MRIKLKFLSVTVIILVLAVSVLVTRQGKIKTASDEVVKDVAVIKGDIRSFISTTGTVLPKNRLEIKPPVAGRIEKILVREGDEVKEGQILGWMSSTERAAIIDAARGKDEKTLEYWQETYKPIPLIAPVKAEVIVAKTQSGQTITTTEAVLVLSDRLIVRAQVDETDIGKIKPAMAAVVTLDAYPDKKIDAVVDHIYYESKIDNNVTTYEVDLIIDETPVFFRSGMNANVDFVEQSRQDVLIIPLEAVEHIKDEAFVVISRNGLSARQRVRLGASDEQNAEVIEGLKLDDKILVKTKKYQPLKNNKSASPLLPFGARSRR